MTIVPCKSDPSMTVRRLAQRGGVTVHVMRNYLRRGLLEAAADAVAGYQVFSATELERSHFIRTGQRLCFTLAEVEEILRHGRVSKILCLLVRDIIALRPKETRAKLKQSVAMQGPMTKAAEHWTKLSDAVPKGNEIRALIQAVSSSEAIPLPTTTPQRLLERRASLEA